VIFSKPIAYTSCPKRIIHCTKSKQHLKIGRHGSVRIPIVPFGRGQHWTPVKLCPYGEGHARFIRVTIVVTMTRCGHKLSLQRRKEMDLKLLKMRCKDSKQHHVMFHGLCSVSLLLCIAQNVRFEIPFKVLYFETPFLMSSNITLGCPVLPHALVRI